MVLGGGALSYERGTPVDRACQIMETVERAGTRVRQDGSRALREEPYFEPRFSRRGDGSLPQINICLARAHLLHASVCCVFRFLG